MISVIVPVHNEERNIGPCLEALLAMAPPDGRLEVIVVDNDSSDDTRAVASRYPVIVEAEPTPGGPAARNRGLAVAQGDILAFTDADCRVDPAWAREIETTFQDNTVDAVLGYAAGINENIHAAFAQRRWEESWFIRDAERLTPRHSGIDTRNCAVRCRTFAACGKFDPGIPYCGDLEFSIRLNRARCRIAFNPRMVVWHRNPTSFAQILSKSRNQLDSVLRIRQRLREDDRREDIPFPSTAFYGLAQRDLSPAGRGVALGGLRLLRLAVLAVSRTCMGLGIDHPWVFKLHKLFFGLSYEIGLIEAMRAGDDR